MWQLAAKSISRMADGFWAAVAPLVPPTGDT
jgi:hypothetical protein